MSTSHHSIEIVYQTHVEKLYKFFYFKVLNTQVAEDLTSDTFLALAEKLATLPDDEVEVTKYLYGIARNKWNMYLRMQYKEQSFTVGDIDDFAHYVQDEVDAMQSRSLKDRAIYFINLLPPKQRIVAMLRLIEGLLPSEIAMQINKPINYVKVTLRRALARLRELIASTTLAEEHPS